MTLGYYWANSHIQPVAGYYYLSLLRAQPPDNLRNVSILSEQKYQKPINPRACFLVYNDHTLIYVGLFRLS